MTPEEKIIYYIRKALIEKHGEEFTELDEESQNELILLTFRDHIKAMRGV